MTDDLERRLRGADGCPFCGRDPYHYVDIGVGMQAVAVECCELGINLLQHQDEQLVRELSLRTEAADEIARLRAENEALRKALAALRLQALQSDLNDPANEWGWEALQLANAALKGSRHE